MHDPGRRPTGLGSRAVETLPHHMGAPRVSAAWRCGRFLNWERKVKGREGYPGSCGREGQPQGWGVRCGEQAGRAGSDSYCGKIASGARTLI